MQSEDSSLDHPFGHIALSLSGGGVRAVGYHLGTLDYLDHAGLLSEVHTLSSVSGGSLVAMGYALSLKLKKEEGFREFYDNICEFLPELNTFEELLRVLNGRYPPVASGARTLITAMAEVYRDKYFGRYYDDAKFGIFWETEPEIPLKEVIFSATEFKTGIAFRFHKSQLNSPIGNGKVWLGEEFAKDIRMSDIMAASSCIPGAMEPMMFPQDFRWPGDPEGKAIRRGKGERPTCKKVESFMKKEFGITTVPLMDGGIYDNQGITSIILSAARNNRGSARDSDEDDEMYDEQVGLEPLRPHSWAKWALRSMAKGPGDRTEKDMGDVDLFIVSDTPVRRDPMYVAEAATPSAGKGLVGWIRNQRLQTVNFIGWILTIVLTASIADGLSRLWRSFHSTEHTLFGQAVPALLSNTLHFLMVLSTVLVVLLALYGLARLHLAASKLADRASHAMPPIHPSIWSYVKRLRVGQIVDMAMLRAGSMSALTSRIFMNRIRQLGYSLLYSHDEYGRKVMDNNISDIKTMKSGRLDDLPEFLQHPSKKMLDVVDRASSMGTKLWIDKPDHEHNDLEVLIASGHVSTCFNILEYLWEFHRDEKGRLNENVVALFKRAEADWQRLNEDPYCLVELRKEEGRKPGSLFWDSSVRPKRRWSGRRRQATTGQTQRG